MTKNIFVELHKKYTSKLISKDEYIDLAYRNHKILFEYADYLKKTEVASISILDKEVKMTMRKDNIILVCPRNDLRAAPFETLNFKNFEGEFFNLYLELIKKAKVVFDIGANIGWHDLYAAKKFKKIKVYSFEPVKETFDYLVKNIKINNLSNVIPNNIGLSNKNSISTFFVNPNLLASASEKKITEANVKKVKVKLIKLDDFCTREKISKIDLIKCDVEGAELFVFKGGVDIIKKTKPVIMTEMLRKWSKKYDYHPNDIINFFKNLNYECFTIEKNKLKKVVNITEKTKATNFIFFHKIKHCKHINKYD